jgi:signal transduction histidine kinase
VREVGELSAGGFTVGAPEDVVVRGGRDLPFEAIANLVDNAVKFTPEGGMPDASPV